MARRLSATDGAGRTRLNLFELPRTKREWWSVTAVVVVGP
jgi:hypothetical protein